MVVLSAGTGKMASNSDPPKGKLEAIIPDPQQLSAASKFEKIPYLNAVIHEALRPYPSATHRQYRAAPDEELVYRDVESDDPSLSRLARE
ncbi:hypothetical protein ACSS6W_007563 [Trichoderma asperelloides]